jgi:hypothetical protein
MSDFKIIIDRVTALSQFAAKGVLFNLNYMPDTILGGIVLFALLLQSAPLALLGTSLFSLEFVHAGLAAFLNKAIPGLNEASKDVARCSGHFPGISYERATATLLDQGTLKTLSVSFPSYYMMFFGALFGYMIGMAQTYERELNGMPQKRAGVVSGVVVMGLFTLMFGIYRVGSGCDSFLSILVGLLAGFVFGYGVESLIALLSDRALTNLMNVPIIRDRATDGKPIYVCKKQ